MDSNTQTELTRVTRVKTVQGRVVLVVGNVDVPLSPEEVVALCAELIEAEHRELRAMQARSA